MSGLAAFNSAPAADLRPLLTACLAVPRWVDAVLAGRPYPTEYALFDTAKVELDDDEVRAAVAGHPRIGEDFARGGVPGRWSAEEQSGVDRALADRLAAANAAYEQRFGHIYLVCAPGLSGKRVLADLAARLDNPPDVELRVVNAELAAIAKMRLRKVLHPHHPRGS